MTELGYALLALGTFLIIAQWSAILAAQRDNARRIAAGTPPRGYSSVPLLGGGLVFAGSATLGSPAVGFLGLVADPGCWFVPWLVAIGARKLRHLVARDRSTRR